MSQALRVSLGDYLQIRRALGFKLAREEQFVNQFIAFLERRQAERPTSELALEWASSKGTDPAWWAHRLTAVRGFMSYLHTLDATIEIPARVFGAPATGRPRLSTPTPSSRRCCAPPSCCPRRCRPRPTGR